MKKVHRKNALFYKSLAGARVGDVFMSLIHTAELNGVAPFEYLVALQQHHQDVALDPSEWLPWNYEATLAELRARGESAGLSCAGRAQRRHAGGPDLPS